MNILVTLRRLKKKVDALSNGISRTSLSTDVQTSLAKADTAYQKPSDGIPKTDLDSSVQESLNNADNAVPKAIETTYSELKALRDNSQLIPGCWYRITDYECTTSEEDTMSARHQFDILVLATSNSTLSEDAKAIQNERYYYGIYVDDGNHCVYPRFNGEENYKKTVHFTDATKELYLWTYEGKLGWYSELPIEELRQLTPEQLNSTLWYWLGDWNKIDVISDNEISYNESCVPSRWQDINWISYSFNFYFEHSNLEAWELKYTLDNVQWSTKAGTYVDDTDSEYKFYVLGDITLQGHTYKLLQGLGRYAVEYGEYALVETVEQGEPIYYYDGDPEWFDPEELEQVGVAIDIFTLEEGEGGHGTITYMKDEFGNECPYDFKNIQFKRYLCTDSVDGRSGLNGMYMAYNPWDVAKNLSVDDPNKLIFAYTFSSDNGQEDYSLTSEHNVYDNIIKPYSDGLPNNVIFGEGIYGNTFGNDCYGNSFGNNSCGNSLGDNCRGNSFGNGCCNNSLGGFCSNNSLGDGFQDNSWGDSCNSNSWFDWCCANYCGNNCIDNSLGEGCSFNSWGNNCDYNSWGNYITNSTVFDGVQYTQITTEHVRNVQVLNGVAGTANKLTLSFDANKNYTQVATLNSSGQLKIYVPGDLVQ